MHYSTDTAPQLAGSAAVRCIGGLSVLLPPNGTCHWSWKTSCSDSHVMLPQGTHTRAVTNVWVFSVTQARLVGIYETSSAAGLQQLALRYTLPQQLVRQVGAPETLWTVIR